MQYTRQFRIYCRQSYTPAKEHPTKPCTRCGSVFAKKPEWTHAFWAKAQFCSKECRVAARRLPLLTCNRCGAEFKKRRGARNTNEFCSLTCWHEERREILYPIPVRHDNMFTRTHKRALLERANGKCETCSSTEQLEFDHIIPRHLGGKGTLENGQVLCRACHLSKTAEQQPSRVA